MLIVKNLTFSYRYRRIFTDLSFQVDSGEILQIAGPNGCGKTTLMSILAGLRSPTRGSVALKTEKDESVEDSFLLSQHTEYLPAEANALYGKMDALDNLRFWLHLRGIPRKDSEQLVLAELARWDLDHPLICRAFPIEKFSTGMKRRLALARVSLSFTRCWLLDEPLYGLDQKGIETFQSMLKKHLDTGGSVAIVSHDTKPLEEFKPRLLWMQTPSRGGLR